MYLFKANNIPPQEPNGHYYETKSLFPTALLFNWATSGRGGIRRTFFFSSTMLALESWGVDTSKQRIDACQRGSRGLVHQFYAG